MEQYYFVPRYILTMCKNKLENTLKESGLHETSRTYQKIEGVAHTIKIIMAQESNKVPVELVPGVTKKDVMEKLDVAFVFDYALPQSWFEYVQEELGINPLPHFVWNVDNNTPYPITETGRTIMSILMHRS